MITNKIKRIVGARSLLVMLLVPLWSIAAAAQPVPASGDPAAAADIDGWSFRLAPYGWATALNGRTGVRGVSADVSLSLGDVLSRVDGAIMLAFEAKRGNWGLTADVIRASLSDSSGTPRGVIYSKASMDLEETVWTETLSYTALQSGRIKLDAAAGFRLMSVNTDLDLSGAAAQSRDLSQDQTWIDPIIGFRGAWSFSDTVRGRFLGDIGGFDASSTLTWQALAGLDYVFSPSSAFGLGYRAIGYDHNRDSYRYDLTMHGPFLGAEFHF